MALMKRYSVSESDFHRIIDAIKEILASQTLILFAYLHGSFTGKHNFRDIDIAIYVQDLEESKYMDYEFELEEILKKKTGFPVDVRILNHAPPYFCYSAIKSRVILVDRDENRRADFESLIIRKHLDFLPYRQRYLEEALRSEL